MISLNDSLYSLIKLSTDRRQQRRTEPSNCAGERGCTSRCDPRGEVLLTAPPVSESLSCTACGPYKRSADIDGSESKNGARHRRTPEACDNRTCDRGEIAIQAQRSRDLALGFLCLVSCRARVPHWISIWNISHLESGARVPSPGLETVETYLKLLSGNLGRHGKTAQRFFMMRFFSCSLCFAFYSFFSNFSFQISQPSTRCTRPLSWLYACEYLILSYVRVS